MCIDLCDPRPDVLEADLVSDIVYQKDAVGVPVVRRRDRSEPLLSGSVPLFSTVSSHHHGSIMR